MFGILNVKILNTKTYVFDYEKLKHLRYSSTYLRYILLDSNLRFETDVAHQFKFTFIKLIALHLSKDLLETDTRLILNNILVFSNVSYCSSVYWPALLSRDRLTLEQLHNCCIRFSFDLRKFDLHSFLSRLRG